MRSHDAANAKYGHNVRESVAFAFPSLEKYGFI